MKRTIEIKQYKKIVLTDKQSKIFDEIQDLFNKNRKKVTIILFSFAPHIQIQLKLSPKDEVFVLENNLYINDWIPKTTGKPSQEEKALFKILEDVEDINYIIDYLKIKIDDGVSKEFNTRIKKARSKATQLAKELNTKTNDILGVIRFSHLG